MIISKMTAYVPEPPHAHKPERYVLQLANALFAELAHNGIIMAQELHERIASLNYTLALRVTKDLLDELTVGSEVQLNRSLFANWEDRQYMSLGDCVLQIVAWTLPLNGNMLNDPEFTRKIHKNVDYEKVKLLRLASEDEFKKYFSSLVNSKTALDQNHIKRLQYVCELCSHRLIELPRIRSAEIRVAGMLELTKHNPLGLVLAHLQCEPIDVLRFFAARNKFESLKLPSDVKFSTLSWQERKAVLAFWNTHTFEELGEAMGNKRTAWSRFFKHIHMFQQREFVKFETAYLSAMVSVGSRQDVVSHRACKELCSLILKGLVEVTDGGTLVYRTFASRIDSAVKRKDTTELLVLINQRPGWAFRNLNTILGCVSRQDARAFADALIDILPKVQIATLLAILGINPNAQWRVIKVNDKTHIEPANYGPVFGILREHIIAHIREHYGYTGRVTTSALGLRNRVVPFISRNSELERGSSVEVDVDKRYLYMMMHWIQPGSRNTDLDLSIVAFDDQWDTETVWYGEQAHNWMNMSGDIRSAPGPNGATEYGRVDLDEIPSNIRYILPTFNVFEGAQFGECEVCRAGFFASTSENFKLSQEGNYYDVNAKAEFHAPFVYDVRANKIIQLDYSQGGPRNSSIHAYIDDVKKLIEASNAANPVTIGNLADWLSGGNNTQGDLLITEQPDPNDTRQIGIDRLFTLFE